MCTTVLSGTTLLLIVDKRDTCPGPKRQKSHFHRPPVRLHDDRMTTGLSQRVARVSIVGGILAALAAATFGFAATAEAAQTPTPSSVVRAWQSDPIYNDPMAPKKLSDSDLTTVRAAVERAGTPMYVAVKNE